jgi:hypothetical protein
LNKKISLREGILDALVDDGESIVQIEGALKYLEIPFERQLLKKIIVELLNESLIEIAYPLKKNIIDFFSSNGETIEDYWFELTKKGYAEWQKIDY